MRLPPVTAATPYRRSANLEYKTVGRRNLRPANDVSEVYPAGCAEEKVLYTRNRHDQTLIAMRNPSGCRREGGIHPALVIAGGLR